MALISRLAALLSVASALAFAESWSGSLVDSKCYAAEERNTRENGLTSVDRDRSSEIAYCSPNVKTQSFAIVLNDGASWKLDSSGNAKAAMLVQKTGKKSAYVVNVTGAANHGMVNVSSISMAQ
jgi:hypothetical protein